MVRRTLLLRLAPAAILSWLAGCGGSGQQLRGEDGRHARRVERVEIVGNVAFPDGAIEKRLATRGPRGLVFKEYTSFDPLVLRQDVERVRAFYRERGYFDAAVRDFRVRPLGHESVEVDILVHEGPPTRIRSIDIVGAPDRPGAREDDLRALVPLREGQVFRHPDYLRAKELLRGRLITWGYAHAEVEGAVLVDRDARTARIRFELDPGPLVRFGGKVRVEGAGDVPEQALLARVQWKPGAIFDPDRIDRTRTRIVELGVFSSVRIDYPQEGRPAVVEPVISVRPGLRHEVRLGGGVNVDQERVKVRARAGYQVRNFLRPLTTLDLDVRPGYVVWPGTSEDRGIAGEAEARLETHDFLAPLVIGRARVGYEVDVFEGYSTRGPFAGWTVARPFFSGKLLVSAGWSLSHLELDEEVPGILQELGVDEPYRPGFYEQSLVYDPRAQPLDAQRGIFFRLRLEEGGPWAGGRFEYLKVFPELRGYVNPTRRIVLAAYARAGAIRALGDELTPFAQRFYGGGATGHRGFAYRRLSPMVRAVDGRLVPIGGNAILESSLEGRLDALRIGESWLGFAAFLDAGDATSEFDELEVGRLHYAIGLGLRYGTIVGPLRLDVAYRLNRTSDERRPDGTLANPDPGERLAFHFSLGEAF